MSKEELHSHPSDRLAFRLRRIWLALGISLGVLIALVMLGSFSGYCYKDLRHYSDRDIMDIAVRATLERGAVSGKQNKIYNSFEEFLGAAYSAVNDIIQQLKDDNVINYFTEDDAPIAYGTADVDASSASSSMVIFDIPPYCAWPPRIPPRRLSSKPISASAL